MRIGARGGRGATDSAMIAARIFAESRRPMRASALIRARLSRRCCCWPWPAARDSAYKGDVTEDPAAGPALCPGQAQALQHGNLSSSEHYTRGSSHFPFGPYAAGRSSDGPMPQYQDLQGERGRGPRSTASSKPIPAQAIDVRLLRESLQPLRRRCSHATSTATRAKRDQGIRRVLRRLRRTGQTLAPTAATPPRASA